MRTIIIALSLLFGSVVTAVAADPQRMVGGGTFPVYVNNTGSSQAMTPDAYVNQTTYTPASTPVATGLTTLGAGN